MSEPEAFCPSSTEESKWLWNGVNGHSHVILSLRKAGNEKIGKTYRTLMNKDQSQESQNCHHLGFPVNLNVVYSGKEFGCILPQETALKFVLEG